MNVRIVTWGLILLMFVLMSTSSNASSLSESAIQTRFQEANEQLNNSQFDQAMAGYRQILEHGFESGALYLNMGLTSVRMDSLGLAKFYFLKAARFPEVNIAASEALQFTEFELSRRGARIPQLAWIEFKRSLYFNTDHVLMIKFGILLINLGALLFAIHWLRNYLRKTNGFIGMVLGMTGTLLICAGIVLHVVSGKFDQAVQIEREVHVYQIPDIDSEILYSGYEGFQYIVNRNESSRYQDWYYIRMNNGARGWIPRTAVKKL